MLNVLIYGLKNVNGGIESVILNYFNYFDKKAMHFTFLSNEPITLYKKNIENYGCSISTIPKRSKHPIKFYREVKRFFSKNAFDVIWDNESSLTNITILKYAKKYGCKKRIIHGHASKYHRKGLLGFVLKFLHFWHKLCIKNVATDFWCCSSNAGKFFYSKKIIQGSKFKIISNFSYYKKFIFDNKLRERCRKELDIKQEYVFGVIGRLEREKNQSFAIHLLSKILRHDLDAKLVLIGGGSDYNKLHKMCMKLNIVDKVIFTGPKENVNYYLNGIDALLLPSFFEGYGIVGVEGQCNGLKVYASNGVPTETKFLDCVKFMPLKQKKWIDEILGDVSISIDRSSAYKIFEENKIGINFQAKKVQQYLKE